MQIRFDEEVRYKQSKSTCQNNICVNWLDQQKEKVPDSFKTENKFIYSFTLIGSPTRWICSDNFHISGCSTIALLLYIFAKHLAAWDKELNELAKLINNKCGFLCWICIRSLTRIIIKCIWYFFTFLNKFLLSWINSTSSNKCFNLLLLFWLWFFLFRNF